MEVRATPHKKLQSAMEYLMTYGWAILVIAVVLGALFSLGVFSGASLLGTSCVAASGFYCSGVTLTSGGVLTLTVGQAYGYTFNNTQVLFVPSGAPLSEASSVSIGNLNSGQTQTVSIQLPSISPYPSSYSLGTPLTGYVYLTFTNPYKTTSTEEIATVTTKVASSSTAVLYSKPSTLPSGITSYVPIEITNQQSTATPAPFQQMVQFQESTYSNYIAYNGNTANFEFFTGNGAIIPAWIESNNSGTITVWLKLANGVGPGSANAITIYLGFASPSTNLLSSSGTSGIGEAPQLSSTYGQYDDGASVFSNYWNFAGTSLPSGWTTQANGDNIVVDNGITMTTAGSDYVAYAWYNTALNPQNTVLEAYFTAATSNGAAHDETIDWITSTSLPTTAGWPSTPFIAVGMHNTFEIYNGSSQSSGNTQFTPVIVSIAYTSSNVANPYFDYSSQNVPSESANSLMSSAYPTIELNWGGYNTLSIDWLRTRAYPPNGVMPSVSFGSVS
ncbi:MAG: hypothetical protein QXT36_02645 [Candidatus Micrarchaeaceae archaeon]